MEAELRYLREYEDDGAPTRGLRDWRPRLVGTVSVPPDWRESQYQKLYQRLLLLHTLRGIQIGLNLLLSALKGTYLLVAVVIRQL